MLKPPNSYYDVIKSQSRSFCSTHMIPELLTPNTTASLILQMDIQKDLTVTFQRKILCITSPLSRMVHLSPSLSQ